MRNSNDCKNLKIFQIFMEANEEDTVRASRSCQEFHTSQTVRYILVFSNPVIKNQDQKTNQNWFCLKDTRKSNEQERKKKMIG